MSAVGLAAATGVLSALAALARGLDLRSAPSPAPAVHPDASSAHRGRRLVGSSSPADDGSGWWEAALLDAGVEGDARRWARVVTVTLGATAVLGAVVAGGGGAVVVPLATAAGGAVALRTAAGRGARRADATLPDLLEHAARALRSGVDLVPALAQAATTTGGPHARQVRAATDRVTGGAPVATALEPWADAHPRRPVHLVVAALEVALASGSARARALDGVAATLRDQAALAAEVRALASQAQASAAVLVALPVVFAVVGSAADPRLAHTLLGTPAGLACGAGALVLDLAGACWMHRIVHGEPDR